MLLNEPSLAEPHEWWCEGKEPSANCLTEGSFPSISAYDRIVSLPVERPHQQLPYRIFNILRYRTRATEDLDVLRVGIEGGKEIVGGVGEAVRVGYGDDAVPDADGGTAHQGIGIPSPAATELAESASM